MNADGVRLQAWWAQNFRFLPAQLNHALVGRITQYCMDDPSLAVPWDHAGWRYALLSGLAVGGTITATILPEDLDAVDDMRTTYAGWLDWARRHHALVAFDTALGAQVRAGGVDIHARVDGRSGVIFLANPGPRTVRVRLPLDRSIGLEEPGRYRLVVQTPERGPCIVGPDGTAALMAPGAVPIDVPAHTVLVLALEPALGDAGQTMRSTDLRSPTIAVDGWTDDRGNPVPWPIHPAADALRMSTLIRVDDGAIARIRGRRSPGADRVAAVVAAQRERGFPDSFAWSRPDRLLLVVPFSDADQVGRVALRVDGQPAPIERFVVAPPGDLRLSGEPLPGRLPATTICWWADLTDVLGEGRDNRLELSIDGIAANQFLGPWLEAPGSRWDLEAPGVRSVADDEPAGSASTGWSGAIPGGGLVVPRIIDEGMPPAPRVVRAWLEPATLRAGIPATIRAEVDADEREVSGVFCSTLVGPGVFTDVALHPLGDRTWSHTFLVGERREVIHDPAASRVWAVARDGQPTQPMVIPMRWALEPRRADMSRATGARRRDG